MRHIQEFKKEVGDTPRIMYARLARFARESGDAFTERNLVSLYMAKQEKRIQQMAHPQLLFLYGGRATLAQAFAIVEQLDRGLCVEEAGRLPIVMTTTTTRDHPIGGAGKAEKDRKRQQAMAAMEASMNTKEEDTPQATNVRCWSCGEEGHTKKVCPHKAPPQTPPGGRGSQSTTRGGRGGRGGRGNGGGNRQGY